MINKDLYQAHIAAIPDALDSRFRIVRDMDKIEEFEKMTGKPTGLIDNEPFYSVCLDVYENTETSSMFRYVNVFYSRMGAAVLPVIIMNEKRFILLEKHYRVFTQKMHLEIPRGFADPCDMCSDVTALRELQEETGLTLHSNMIDLGEIYPDTGLSNAKVSLKVAEIVIPDGQQSFRNHDTEEEIETYRLCTIEEMDQLILDNSITDSFTIAAFYRYRSMNKC